MSHYLVYPGLHEEGRVYPGLHEEGRVDEPPVLVEAESAQAAALRFYDHALVVDCERFPKDAGEPSP